MLVSSNHLNLEETAIKYYVINVSEERSKRYSDVSNTIPIHQKETQSNYIWFSIQEAYTTENVENIEKQYNAPASNCMYAQHIERWQLFTTTAPIEVKASGWPCKTSGEVNEMSDTGPNPYKSTKT
jgi:hypothetical protein